MSYTAYIELFKAFIPTIVMIGATSATWKICDFYEKLLWIHGLTHE